MELGPDEGIPDAKTLWLFRQRLTEEGLIDELFERFSAFLNDTGYQVQGGQILDASLIFVPIQRNSKEENLRMSRMSSGPIVPTTM